MLYKGGMAKLQDSVVQKSNRVKLQLDFVRLLFLLANWEYCSFR